MIKHITNLDEFEKETASSAVLVDFFATWCGPCRMLSPVLEKLDEENKLNASIIKVDVDNANEIASKFAIQVIPTLVLFKDGKAIKRATGYMPEGQLIKFVNE